MGGKHGCNRLRKTVSRTGKGASGKPPYWLRGKDLHKVSLFFYCYECKIYVKPIDILDKVCYNTDSGGGATIK